MPCELASGLGHCCAPSPAPTPSPAPHARPPLVRQSRRREQERLERLDAEWQAMKEREEFERRQAERAAADEERTAKKREKRNKKKVGRRSFVPLSTLSPAGPAGR